MIQICRCLANLFSATHVHALVKKTPSTTFPISFPRLHQFLQILVLANYKRFEYILLIKGISTIVIRKTMFQLIPVCQRYIFVEGWLINLILGIDCTILHLIFRYEFLNITLSTYLDHPLLHFQKIAGLCIIKASVY